MYLIVGLGNPGREYEKTRHNVGFRFSEKLRDKIEAGEFALEKKLKSEVVKGEVNGQKVIIAKPQTFMNLSGNAVQNLLGYFKIDLENLIVASDDYNLEVGVARMRFAGEAGGHNGLKSIIETNNPDFWRMRIGIGEPGNEKPEKFVLNRFSASENKKIDEIIDKSVDLLIQSISGNNFENKTIQ